MVLLTPDMHPMHPMHTASWQPKCKQMLNMMGRMFSIDKPIFWNDVSPKVLPDYYVVRRRVP